ncbi:MAG: hypothetical protein WDO15_01550 [Bacteroidota bacterium]
MQADLRMMIDHDQDGFADNDITPKTGTLAGNIFTVTAVNLADGDYFTIGTVNAAHNTATDTAYGFQCDDCA